MSKRKSRDRLRKHETARAMTGGPVRSEIVGASIKNIQPVEGGREEVDEALSHMTEREEDKTPSREVGSGAERKAA